MGKFPFEKDDMVRFRAGATAAYGTPDNPDRRGEIGRVADVIDIGQGDAMLYLQIEWQDGLERAGRLAADFEKA